MSTVNVQDLQRNPMAYLDRVEAGERFIVARDGRPVAELHPYIESVLSTRPFGLCAGKFVVPDDFDAPLSDELVREFEGR